MTIASLVDEFAHQHDMPQSFRETARTYYLPLAEKLADTRSQRTTPLLLGIHGCQGSGKSTLTDFLLFCFYHLNIKSVGFSLDDFYLTRAERRGLAETKHPLLMTRGVPGTHDLPLLNQVLDALLAGRVPVDIPVFNKAQDDRTARERWQSVEQAPDIIVFEGWCVGSLPETEAGLAQPVNRLETVEDSRGDWRGFVNEQLAGPYQQLFQRLQLLVMLQAPSFDTVVHWRREQEERLVAKLTRLGQPTDAAMTPEQIQRFVDHYQRITEHSLISLPAKADAVFALDEHRRIVQAQYRGALQ